MKRFVVFLLAAVMIISLCACGNSAPANSASSQPQVLRVGMECAYAPNNWLETTASDSNLPISNVDGSYADGYNVQIAKLIGEKAGYDIEIVMLAWDGLIEALNQGQIDMIIPVYCIAAVTYLILTCLSSLLMKWIGKKLDTQVQPLPSSN